MENKKKTIRGFNLTAEQDNFIEVVMSGKNIKGSAFAGAGKTTVLLAIEKYYVGKRGLYTCFNKALEVEARKLFTSSDISISTSHSLALKDLSRQDKMKVLSCIGKRLTTERWIEESEFPLSQFNEVPAHLIVSLIDTVTESFYQSASEEISKIHLTEKSYKILDRTISEKKLKLSEKERFVGEIIKSSRVIAVKVMSEQYEIPKTHDSYLKKWQLSKPKLNFDYIMFDECQDSSPVLLSVVLSQQCQKIFVGDEYQSIYQFRGCINAMGMLPYENFPLTQSFRYGQKLANLAQKVLHHINKSVSITGSGFDTQIIRASDYNSAEKILIVSNTNIECYENLLHGYLSDIPMTLIGENKIKTVQTSIAAMIEIKDLGLTTHPYFRKYHSLEGLLERERSGEAIRLAQIVQEGNGKALIDAFDWSTRVSGENALFSLTTAHMSKGLEADNVFISDDFISIVDAFSNGNEIAIVDLYLFYVAITRAKKKLILSDSVYLALEKNSNFKIIKPAVLERHTDGIPEINDNKNSPAKEAENVTTEVSSEKVENEPLKSQDDNRDLQLQKEKKKFIEEHPAIKKMKATPNSNGVNHDAIAVEVGIREVDNEPQYWTPTDTNRFMNPNLAILGTMGTGKTETVKSMLYQLHQQRQKNTGGVEFGSLIFDYKKDFCGEEFVKNNNVLVLEANKLPINPFTLINKNRLAPIKTARSVVTTLTKAFKLGTVQQQNLKKSAMLAYERCGIDNHDPSTFDNLPPTFKDVMDIYFNQEKVPNDSLTAAFETIHDFNLFEDNKKKCKNLFDTLKGRTVVVSISGLDIHIQSLIVALFLDVFYLSMHLTPKPKPTKSGHRALTNLIMVDEADNIMSRNFESLRKILKEGREFGVGCILSTQGYDHFKTDENSYSDYMNAWIIHRLEAIKPTSLSSLFNINNKKDIGDYALTVKDLIKHHSIFLDGKNNLTYQESTAFWKLTKKN